MTRLLRGTAPALLLCAGLLMVGSAQAEENYGIEIRVISAQPGGGGIDPALRAYARDFKAMPYKSFKLLDSHRKTLRKGETVSMQFPGQGRRLMKVRSNGKKGGKHGITLAIDALNFKTSVRIPERGTLIVGGPKHEKGVILLAVTARTAR